MEELVFGEVEKCNYSDCDNAATDSFIVVDTGGKHRRVNACASCMGLDTHGFSPRAWNWLTAKPVQVRIVSDGKTWHLV